MSENVIKLLYKYNVIYDDDLIALHKFHIEVNNQKRQFGLYQGKGSFKLSNDWQINNNRIIK